MRAFTDYPMLHLGDESGKVAPIREVEVISYDTDKYVLVRLVEDGSLVEFKRFYLYTEAVRNGEGVMFDVHQSGVDQNPSPWDDYDYISA